MLGFSAFTRKPRAFNYKPVYFDAEKEARDERRRELFGDKVFDEQTKGEDYVAGSYIRKHGFSKARLKMDDTPRITAEQRMQKIRRAIIALILLLTAGAYLIFS